MSRPATASKWRKNHVRYGDLACISLIRDDKRDITLRIVLVMEPHGNDFFLGKGGKLESSVWCMNAWGERIVIRRTELTVIQRFQK